MHTGFCSEPPTQGDIYLQSRHDLLAAYTGKHSLKLRYNSKDAIIKKFNEGTLFYFFCLFSRFNMVDIE